MECRELLEQIDIHEYIAQYVELEERNGELWGLSPFNEEKTPSFSVNTDAQQFFDFSSGKGGDLLTFVQEYHNVSLPKGMKILMDFAGIEDDGEYYERPSYIREMQKYLPKKKKKKEYINRSILAPSCMNEYKNDRGALMNWVNQGVCFDVLEKHQVKYNPIDDSLVFPLFDSNGNIISVCSRTLCGRDPKYLPYKKFDGVDFLYWEYQNRQNILDKNEMIIFEGAKSVMVAESFGYNNCVSTQTNHLNDEQIKIIIKLGVKVVFAYDKGVDIRLDNNIEKLSHFTKIEYVQDNWSLLKNKDAPIDYGKDIWDYLYKRRSIF